MRSHWLVFCLIGLWINPLICFSQDKDSLKTLSEVVIYAPRLLEWSTGQNTQHIDSAVLRSFDTGSLADLLQEFSPVFVKSYGPGALASPAMRGGNAGQTAIVWNGVNLQSPMNGQLDLSLIPISMVQDLYIQPGGGSALYGSGAISGSLHLLFGPKFEKAWMVGIKNSVGSFGKNYLGGEISYGTKRFFSSANGLVERANGWLSHSAYAQKALMYTLGYKISERHRIWGQIWRQQFQREIPLSGASQEDANLRVHMEWNYTSLQWKSTVKTAYINEGLYFEDSLQMIHSDNFAQKGLIEAESHLYLNPAISLQWGANLLMQWSLASGYGNQSFNRNEEALFFSLKKSWKQNRWNAVLNLRQAWLGKRMIPFMPSWGIEGKLSGNLSIHANISRNYRLPTFNDLYWQPGGNPHLLPESGWGEEAGFLAQKKAGNISFKTYLTTFNRQVNNWIIWLPGRSFWSPENVRRVWSRGLETGGGLEFSAGSWRLKAKLDYGWTKSTRQFTLSPQDEGEHKQLIYTPEHQLKLFGKGTYKDLEIAYSHQFIGKRFTSSDNLFSLPVYQLGNLRLFYTFRLNQIHMQTGFVVANIWNENYQIVAGRPMPGRNFTVKLSVYFHKKSATP